MVIPRHCSGRGTSINLRKNCQETRSFALLGADSSLEKFDDGVTNAAHGPTPTLSDNYKIRWRSPFPKASFYEVAKWPIVGAGSSNPPPMVWLSLTLLNNYEM